MKVIKKSTKEVCEISETYFKNHTNHFRPYTEEDRKAEIAAKAKATKAANKAKKEKEKEVKKED